MMVLLTGRLPTHLGSDPCTGELLWRQHAPEVDGILADVLDRATRYHPRERFSSSGEMLVALQMDLTQVSPVQASPSSQVPTIQQTNHQEAANPLSLFNGWKGLMGAIALIGIGSLLLFRSGQPNGANAPIPVGGASPSIDIGDSEPMAPSTATPDQSEPTASSVVGIWKAELLNIVPPFTGVTHYKEDGTWRNRITYANGFSQEHTGTWQYIDGILLEQSPTLPTTRSAVKWINDNTAEVTILENGNPLQAGLKYIVYRQ